MIFISSYQNDHDPDSCLVRDDRSAARVDFSPCASIGETRTRVGAVVTVVADTKKVTDSVREGDMRAIMLGR